MLTELLISDDDTGRSQMQALTEIERFRQIIKNKYNNVKNINKILIYKGR